MAEVPPDRTEHVVDVTRDDLGLIRRTALATNAAHDPAEAFEAVLAAICDTTGWPVGVWWRLEEREELHLVPAGVVDVSTGPRARALAAAPRPEPTTQAGPAGALARTGASGVAFWRDPPRTRLDRLAGDARLGLGAAFVVLAEEQVAAVLEFFGPPTTAPDRPLLVTVEETTRQLARVVERDLQLQRLRSQSRATALALDDTADGVVVAAPDGTITDWNAPAQRLFGWAADDVVDTRHVTELLVPEGLRRLPEPHLFDQVLADESSPLPDDHARLTLQRRDGQQVAVSTTVWQPRDGQGGLVAVLRPLTPSRTSAVASTAAPDAPASHEPSGPRDPITGLVARDQVLVDVDDRLQERPGSTVVAAVEIDRLGDVNDQFGLVTGDLTLRAVGHRLARLVGTTGLVGRSGADDFLLVLDQEDTSPTALRTTGWELLDAFEAELEGVDVPLAVGVSVGLAAGAQLARPDATALVDAAETALRFAARQGARRVGLHDPASTASVTGLLELNQDLRAAIDGHQFTVHYQPLVDLARQRPSGAEALARWRHPRHGMVPPNQFIPEAERAGLIRQIGRQVLEQACREATRWPAIDGRPPSVNVNVSPVQLDDPAFPEQVEAVLRSTGLAPSRLTLEMTESAVGPDLHGALDRMLALRHSGVQLAVDDFGAGHSSLGRLQHLPFDQLKIDRFLLRHVTTMDEPLPVLEATTRMAHQLGMRVVAEGIETPEQLGAAMRVGCDGAQGYLLARPQTTSQFAQFLADST